MSLLVTRFLLRPALFLCAFATPLAAPRPALADGALTVVATGAGFYRQQQLDITCDRYLADYGLTRAPVPGSAVATDPFVALANDFDHAAVVKLAECMHSHP